MKNNGSKVGTKQYLNFAFLFFYKFLASFFRFLRVKQQKSSSSGFILIIFASFLPIILLGVKYSEQLFKVRNAFLTKTDTSKLYKNCAREAALAVAQNWNPGLTFKQQSEGLYKVADAVYNSHPCHKKNPLAKAIPGVEYEDSKNSDITLEPALKTVQYADEKKYVHNWEIYSFSSSDYCWNRYYGMWLGIDKGSDAINRMSQYDEIDETKLSDKSEYVLNQHELYGKPHAKECASSGASTDKFFDTSYRSIFFTSPSTNNTLSKYSFLTNLDTYKSNNTYVERESSTYSTTTYSRRFAGTRYVQLSIASKSTTGGKIRVKTDDQVAYAIPAECNIDVVLAIPVNGAACNVDNRDTSSNITGNPLSYSKATSFPSSIEDAPIYQMGQACKNFVREHFYHTRGVYMSLIPYSGKVSISPDRAASWTISYPQFVDTAINTHVMIGACLYGTQGQKDAPLTRPLINHMIDRNTAISTAYYWGGLQTGCPIMCRRGSLQSGYGGNSYATGLLLDTTNPSASNEFYKYMRMNLNPCYVGQANMLSMKCDKTCTYFSANPYYMIEPTADLVKIYEMCNALTPFYDLQNTSNFLFIPLEWANNFFQKWTRNAETCVVAGTGSNATLSRPSKTAAGRKKAVIMLVNKPDWFEPGEMTYLGFNNDKSEVPTIISDKIDFSINYGDVSKKFLDGTPYNGIIQGPNKILKATGSELSYDKSIGAYSLPYKSAVRLTFPKKGTIIVKAKSKIGNWTKWNRLSTELRSVHSSGEWHGIAYGKGKFVAIGWNKSGTVAYSDDYGTTWKSAGRPLSKICSDWCCLLYASNEFVALSANGHIATSKDGISWTQVAKLSMNTWRGLCYDGNRFVALNGNGYLAYSTGDDLSSWSAPRQGSTIRSKMSNYYCRNIAYGGGTYVVVTYDGKIFTSNDAETWKYNGVKLGSSSIGSDITYIGSKFLVIRTGSDVIYSSDNGKSWDQFSSNLTSAISSKIRVLLYANGSLYAVSTDGCFGMCPGPSSSALSYISIKNASVSSQEYSVAEPRSIYISPSEIYDSKDKNGNYYIDIDLTHCDLVSAEITNANINVIKPIKLTCADADYEAVDVAKLQIGDSGTETITETIALSNGYDSCYGAKFAVGYAANVGEAKMNRGYGYEIYAEKARPVRIESDYACDVKLYVEPVKTDNKFVRISDGLYRIKSSGWRYHNLAYANNTFIAINYDGTVACSTDCITWTSLGRPLGSFRSSGWEGGCVYGGGNFVAINSNGYAAYSPNGRNWTYLGGVFRGVATSYWLGGGCYDGSKIIIPQENANFAYSTNARDWTFSYSSAVRNVSYNNWRGGFMYGNGKYVSIHRNGGKVVTSTDARNWVNAYPKGITSDHLGCACFANGIFTVITTSGTYRTSNDGKNWTSISTNLRSIKSGGWEGGLCFAKGSLYILNSCGYIATYAPNLPQPAITVNGTKYTLNGSMTIFIPSSQFTKVNGGYYLSFNANNVRFKNVTLTYKRPNIYKYRLTASKAGMAILYAKKVNAFREWISRGNPLNEFSKSGWSNYGNSLIYGNGKFIAVTAGGIVAQSEDGITWTKNQLSCGSCRGVAFLNGYFVALASGNCRYSNNGINWTLGRRVSGTFDDDITAGNGMFLATKDGTMGASKPDICMNPKVVDSVAWTVAPANLNTCGFVSDYNKLTFGNGRFIIRGGRGYDVAYSDDGILWKYAGRMSKSSGSVAYSALGYGNGKFVYLHQDGYIATSTNGTSWTWAGGSSSRPIYTATKQTGWTGIAYAKGRWVAVNNSGYIATYDEPMDTDSWYKINSSKTKVCSDTVVFSVPLASRDSYGNYYADIEMNNLDVTKTVLCYEVTATVDDCIEFCSGNTASENSPYRAISYSGCPGVAQDGLYTFSGNGTITLFNRGALKLKLMPTLQSQTGTFRFTTGSDTSTKMIGTQSEFVVNIGDQLYSKGKSTISFSMSNIALIKAEFIWNPGVEAIDNVKYSSTIDFSEPNDGKPIYNPNYAIFGKGTDKSIKNTTKYDSTVDWWVTTSGDNNFYDMKPYSKNDSYVLVKEYSKKVSDFEVWYGVNGSKACRETVQAPGLSRFFFNGDQNCPSIGFKSHGTHAFIYGGFTKPINAILYNYEYGTEDADVDSNMNPDEDFNRTILKKITTEACNKLIDSGVRVYTILYKPQAGYSYSTRNSASEYKTNIAAHDYSTIVNCAKKSGGKAYEVSRERDLKSTLDKIAADIKAFAGYRKAKNVM